MTRNACGACEPLSATPGDPCGCTGVQVCDGPRLVCEGDSPRNACGGCDSLAPERVGQTCAGGAGLTVCSSPNSTVCRGANGNVCGGTDALVRAAGVPDGAAPGDPCGTCGLGVVRCDGGVLLECADPERGVNVCGSCGPLPAEVGTPCGCGEAGRWACADETGEVICEGASPRNDCGGCEPLDGAPGDSCVGGTLGCAGPNTTRCVASPAACGTADFGLTTNAACGECGHGRTVCVASDQLDCVEDRLRNACGGCRPLAGEPGTYCAAGRTWQCNDDGVVTCAPSAHRNVCGGVARLAALPGDACGACGDGVFTCAGTEAVGCIDSGSLNACGGCSALRGVPGGPCGDCSTGRWACAGPDDVRCVGEDPNAFFASFLDSDGDGFGDPDTEQAVCPNLPGWVRNDDDCDDAAGTVFPGADEVCDAVDNDCDGAVDETFRRWPDRDGDGFGAAGEPVVVCEVGDEWVDNDLDCYDLNINAYPGQTAFFETDRGDGSFDYDCDGTERPSFPEPGRCGNPPLACNFVPSGLRRGFVGDEPTPCGDEGDLLIQCFPADDGCESQLYPTVQACQ